MLVCHLLSQLAFQMKSLPCLNTSSLGFIGLSCSEQGELGLGDRSIQRDREWHFESRLHIYQLTSAKVLVLLKICTESNNHSAFCREPLALPKQSAASWLLFAASGLALSLQDIHLFQIRHRIQFLGATHPTRTTLNARLFHVPKHLRRPSVSKVELRGDPAQRKLLEAT